MITEIELENIHLKRLNDLYEESNKAAKIGVWEFDVETNYVFWSKTTKTIHGVELNYIPTYDEAFNFIKPGKSLELLRIYVAEAISKNIAYDIEMQIIRKDGTELWTRAKCTPEFKDGKCVRLYGTFQDIQDQKTKELALIDSELKMSVVFNNNIDALFLTNPIDGGILNANKSASIMFGYSEEEFQQIGRNGIIDINNPKLPDLLEKRAKEKHITTDLIGIKKDGTRFPIRVSSGIFTDSKGNTQASTCIIDISEIIDARKELISKNKELSRFTSIVSHDLKEPLRMVSQFLAKLEQKYSYLLDDKALLYIFYAVDGAKRMSKMIDELLNYSRIAEKDKTFEIVNVNSVIEDLKKLLNQTIVEKNITIHFRNLPDIFAIKTAIKILFNNLLSNAIKFTSNISQPLININCVSESNYWKFSIQDNGIGIDKEHHDIIFQLFCRLQFDNNYEGTGIGLATCKKIVELHQGKIWVDSSMQNGSTFYFTIKKNIHE